jgi:hypothetical protein
MMSITATVENDTVKLPIHVPNGTEVEITVPLPNADSEDLVDVAGLKVAPAFAWMAEFVGCIDTLPEDFAENHDEYLSGRKKR